MAALEIPWVGSMSADPHSQNDGASGTLGSNDGLPPTVATFSPTNISGNSLTSKQRSTIIVHRKSPLLVATPPAVTRALAYSHPFLLPLNRLAGLLSWTSGDPWESFLLVGAFWAVTLHGSAIILWGGPILVVVALMLGLYSRRYSPLSSTGLTGEKHRRDGSDGSTRPHKTLDEIVETLREFTTRCNILLEPLRDLTDFLSTQRTATSTTTRPALTALLTRIILITPVWILLTLHPIYLITIKRVVITVGTIILTWHSKPARIFRVLLWRSLTIRHICSTITGLQLTSPPNNNNNDQQSSSFTKSSLLSLTPFRSKQQSQHGSTKRRASSSGVRFTFIVYENQRRWLGIGWTYSLFAYERPAWSDEHLNPVPPKDEFELPEVQGSNSKWRWVEGSEWRIDNSPDPSAKKKGKGSKNNDNKDDSGWIYYDNKWHDGRRGQDGWGRYTRRRKWCRDAELVEISPDGDITGTPSKTATENESKHNGDCGKDNNSGDDKNSTKARKRRWFGSADLKGFSAVGSEPSSSTQPINAEPISTSPTTTGSSLPKALSVSSGRSSNNNNGSIRTRNKRPSSIYTEGDRKSQTSSIRDREIEEAENMPDKWGSQSGNAAERAGRGWGLGDDAHMSLS